MSTTEKKDDPVSKYFGENFAQKFYQQAQTPKEIPINEDALKEIIEFAKNNMDPESCKLDWKGKFDVCLVTTPDKMSSIKMRKLEKTGALSVPFLFRPSPNGWMGTIFQTPEKASIVQPGKAYFIIGKYKEDKVEGVMLPKMKVRAIVQLE